ncbi:MAG: zeta toxin family protein, partial [Verrucomicrobiota bacterium]
EHYSVCSRLPELIIVGGPNGAGKSTFVREFLESHSYRYLCADEAAFSLCPEDPESVAVAAGRLFLNQIAEAREKEIDVVIESTPSGKSFSGQIRKFRSSGYRVFSIFVTPINQETSINRVKLRVSKGGHHVPEADIKRRFFRSHKNFWHLYRGLSDEWALFANRSGKGPVLIGFGKDIQFRVDHLALFDQFMENCYVSDT